MTRVSDAYKDAVNSGSFLDGSTNVVRPALGGSGRLKEPLGLWPAVAYAFAYASAYICAAVRPLTVTCVIDRPRERVFDYLADIANHAEFTDHFMREFRLERLPSRGRGAAR